MSIAENLTPAPLAPPVPDLTVIVPTFNEAGNVAELARRLGAAIGPDMPFEVLFVDDSTDDTPDVVRRVAAETGAPLSVLHRDEPVGGLGGAVVEGMRVARADWIVVIDGDLQHPPELAPTLVAEGERAGADIVVATRYAEGGDVGGLANAYRRLVSQVSSRLAQAAFPRALAGVSDPMSGFFAVRKDLLNPGELRPIGFKIMLELIVRSRPGRVIEVPYSFQQRFAGESKSSLRQGVHFLRHLAALRLGSSQWMRTLAFGAVGLTGFLPNLGVLWALTRAGMHYAVASVIATQFAIVWNFLFLDVFVFTGSRRLRLRGRFGSFLALNNLDLLLRIPLLAILVEVGHMGVLPGTVITLVAAFGFRFLVTDRLVYLAKR